MNKKGFATVWIVLIVIIVLVGGGIWYYKTHQSPAAITENNQPPAQTNPSDANLAVASWQTYQDSQLGFTAKYPSVWTMNVRNGALVFSLPNDTAGVDERGQPITVPVSVSISTSSYSTLADYQKYVDSLANGNQGSMNFSDAGYEQIGGKNFFKYGWMHQAQVAGYVVVANNELLDIQFRMEDTILPFDQSASYKDFLTFLANLQFGTK